MLTENNTNILQIMAAPAGMVAYFEGQKKDAAGREIGYPEAVAALALVETKDDTGVYREVRAMTIEPQTDALCFVTDLGGFLALDYDHK